MGYLNHYLLDAFMEHGTKELEDYYDELGE